MTDEQYAEIRSFVRNHPAAVPIQPGDILIGGGIEIHVDEECGDNVRLLYAPPRVELSPANYADLRRRLDAEPPSPADLNPPPASADEAIRKAYGS